jgi:hypothetical protein
MRITNAIARPLPTCDTTLVIHSSVHKSHNLWISRPAIEAVAGVRFGEFQPIVGRGDAAPPLGSLTPAFEVPPL